MANVSNKIRFDAWNLMKNKYFIKGVKIASSFGDKKTTNG